MSERSDLLITADDLAAALTATAGSRPAERAVRVLDVRYAGVGLPSARGDYVAGHVPSAVYVDLDTELARVGDPKEGRHPLPPLDALQADARRWGIDDGDLVVVYDDQSNLYSARAWWLLRYAGVRDVRMLDGGLSAWVAAGHPLEQGEVVASPGSVSLGYGHLRALSLEQAGRFPTTGTLLDARAAARYRGETEPIDPRAGHIPGALSTPTTQNVDADGRFLDAGALRQRFLAAGVDPQHPVATYCGSGVTAAHNAAALMLAGFEPALFPGSWSQWSQHADLPVATGDEAPRVLPRE